jgi:hypothetical protein
MKLAHALNRTVLVAIPDFFGDDETHPCTLIDVDSAGLWLDCDELRDRLGRTDETARAWKSRVTAFFPFARILFVVDPTQFAVLARSGRAPAKPTAARQPRERAGREEPPGEERPHHKDSKRRR